MIYHWKTLKSYSFGIKWCSFCGVLKSERVCVDMFTGFHELLKRQVSFHFRFLDVYKHLSFKKAPCFSRENCVNEIYSIVYTSNKSFSLSLSLSLFPPVRCLSFSLSLSHSFLADN